MFRPGSRGRFSPRRGHGAEPRVGAPRKKKDFSNFRSIRILFDCTRRSILRVKKIDERQKKNCLNAFLKTTLVT